MLIVTSFFQTSFQTLFLYMPLSLSIPECHSLLQQIIPSPTEWNFVKSPIDLWSTALYDQVLVNKSAWSTRGLCQILRDNNKANKCRMPGSVLLRKTIQSPPNLSQLWRFCFSNLNCHLLFPNSFQFLCVHSISSHILPKETLFQQWTPNGLQWDQTIMEHIDCEQCGVANSWKVRFLTCLRSPPLVYLHVVLGVLFCWQQCWCAYDGWVCTLSSFKIALK